MDEAVIKHELPNSIDAERSVIGSMIADRDAIIAVSELLNSDDFYNKQFGMMFDVICDIYKSGMNVDPVILREKLQGVGAPTEITTVDFIVDLVAAVPTTVNVVNYAKIVKEKAVLRRIIKTTDDVRNDCIWAKGDVNEILDKTEKEIFKLTQFRSSGDFVSIKDVVLESLQKIEMASKDEGCDNWTSKQGLQSWITKQQDFIHLS